MRDLPEQINSTEELEEILSEPSDALVKFMGQINGDIIILGAGGKIGPSLAMRAKRAMGRAGVKREVIAVARGPLPGLKSQGILTIQCDLLDLEAVKRLPKIQNVIFLVGRKFGSIGNEPITWAVNTICAQHTAQTFGTSNIVAFSTGCVYPLMDAKSGGASESTPMDPIGEYAMSCLARERMFDYFSQSFGVKVMHFRLNYAIELRYGVLRDIAQCVYRGEPVDITTNCVNVIWQGDACDMAIRSLSLAASPPQILNVTGPETLSVSEIAEAFGRRLGKKVAFTGQASGKAYLSDARQARQLFGKDSASLERLIEWTAHWIERGGENLDKPTHFEVQNGKY